MTIGTSLDDRARAYLAAVRPHLADLPEDERGDLLADLAVHLHEVSAAEDGPLEGALGPPAAFAAELRASAGLPPERRPPPPPASPSPGRPAAPPGPPPPPPPGAFAGAGQPTGLTPRQSRWLAGGLATGGLVLALATGRAWPLVIAVVAALAVLHLGRRRPVLPAFWWALVGVVAAFLLLLAVSGVALVRSGTVTEDNPQPTEVGPTVTTVLRG